MLALLLLDQSGACSTAMLVIERQVSVLVWKSGTQQQVWYDSCNLILPFYLDSCYDKIIPFFGENVFWMTGHLDQPLYNWKPVFGNKIHCIWFREGFGVNPKSSEISHFFFFLAWFSLCTSVLGCFIRDHGSFIFLQISFWERSWAPKFDETSEKTTMVGETSIS